MMMFWCSVFAEHTASLQARPCISQNGAWVVAVWVGMVFGYDVIAACDHADLAHELRLVSLT
jgi:hypothetical protein